MTKAHQHSVWHSTAPGDDSGLAARGHPAVGQDLHVGRRSWAFLSILLRAASVAVCVASMCAVSACVKGVLLRQSLVRDWAITSAELQNLQYYVDEDISLVRVASETGEHHASGRLVTRYGKLYEVIDIKRGTPGVATQVSNDRWSIWVSFEPGWAIEFREGIGDYLSDLYVITHSEKRGNTEYLRYGRFLYELQLPPGKVACLLVESKAISDIATNRRIVPGRRLKK